MLRAYQVMEPHPDPYRDLRLDDNLRRDIFDTAAMLDAYERGLAGLCYVDKAGNSEFGYIEAEYAKVEEIASRLRCQRPHWEKTLMIVDSELTKIKREYEQIERDGRDIAIDGPREHYAKALFAQDRRRREVELQRDQISDLLARMRRALREGGKLRWPLGIPKAPPPAIVPIPHGQAPSPFGLGPVGVSSPHPIPHGAKLEGLLGDTSPGT